MKVAVIGLGSMGKRRIRLIKQIDESIAVIGVDLSEARRKEAEEKLGISVAESLEMLPEGICAAFVSTAPLSHASIIEHCLKRNIHVFSELNLVPDGYESNIALAKERGLVLFLSSPWLYREEVRYIQKAVSCTESKNNYIYHIGQYLPDWHPWESYKSFFVGDKRTNACKELMAIEFPWLTGVFGNVKRFTAFADKMTALDVDYPDNYLIQLEHESGAKGTLAIDIVSRKAVRNLEVYGENLYISWDGSPEGLYQYDCESKENKNISLYDFVDRQAGYSANIVENAYKNEITAFFRQITDGAEPVYSFSDDLAVLDLIERIEAEGQKE